MRQSKYQCSEHDTDIFFFFFCKIQLFYIAWRTGQGLYQLLTMVDAGGTRTCVHTHVSPRSTTVLRTPTLTLIYAHMVHQQSLQPTIGCYCCCYCALYSINQEDPFYQPLALKSWIILPLLFLLM